jgi:hypothetical protein
MLMKIHTLALAGVAAFTLGLAPSLGAAVTSPPEGKYQKQEERDRAALKKTQEDQAARHEKAKQEAIARHDKAKKEALAKHEKAKQVALAEHRDAKKNVNKVAKATPAKGRLATLRGERLTTARLNNHQVSQYRQIKLQMQRQARARSARI